MVSTSGRPSPGPRWDRWTPVAGGGWRAGFTKNGTELFLANGKAVRFQSVSDAGRAQAQFDLLQRASLG
ncbi:hypothetical protein NKH18_34800 [Streptomyces sp. M10(2022)]